MTLPPFSSSLSFFIHDNADKRVVLGSDKPCEGVATSLRFPSQPGSFTPGNYGSEAGPPDGQPDSPIKTSPVSERIKALEALAAKKKEPDFRSDGGFSHFRERHHEKSLAETPKSPTEKTMPSAQKKEGSADQESPESPFEVLGDLRQGNEFEETEEWMKAHLPPVPDFDAVGLVKGTLTLENVTSKEENDTGIVIPDAPAAFAGVPDAFLDSPVEAPKLKDEFSDAQKQPSVEEESEFDLSFLPSASMWDQQEKSGVQPPSNLNSVLPASPAPPAGFGSPYSPVVLPVSTDAKQNLSDDKKPTWPGDVEPPEATEADSSGESDDTVIEDGVSVPLSSSDPAVSNDLTSTPASTAPIPSTEEKEAPPPKSERKLMQVPTINVIETDEPNYSEEEMELEHEAEEDEDYEVVKEPVSEAPKTSKPESEDSENEPPKTRPIETEFMEGYSPPSSPVDSDTEYSPKHKILKSLPDTVHPESASKPELLPDQTDSKALSADFSQAKCEQSQTSSKKVNDEMSSLIVTNEEVDFPDNDDEWSDEAQDTLARSGKTDLTFMEPTSYSQSEGGEKRDTAAKEAYMEEASISRSTFMQDDIYDRQSFDYDYDASSPYDDIDDKGLSNAKERFLSDPSKMPGETQNSTAKIDFPEDSENLEDFTSIIGDNAFPKPRDHSQDKYSAFKSETIRSINEPDLSKKMATDVVADNLTNGNSLPNQKIGSKIQQDAKTGHHAPDTISSLKSTDPDSSVSESTDSFVEFMRECLKSRQDEEPDDVHQSVPPKNEFCKTGLPPSQSPPTMVMDLEQEQLTISALKELGSSQEEEEEAASQKSKVSNQDKFNPNSTSIQQSAFASDPNLPCSQSNLVFDSSYSKEVEAIEEWVAEAYHLAEHVLTAILTHLSGNTSSFWAVGLLTSCSHLKMTPFLTCTL